MMLHVRYHHEVLNFLTKHFFDRMWNIFALLSVVVTVYALLCTIYSDAIVQNNNDFLYLPYKSLSEKQSETTLKELIGKESINKNLYVFVLDISASMRWNKVEEAAYIKYARTIRSVNDTFAGPILVLKGRDKIDIYDIAKARLYELLLALLEKNKGMGKCEFAVWTLGDEGTKIYPEEKKIEVRYSSIADAIKRISNTKGYWDRNTNFVSLFYRFMRVYDEELNKNPLSEYESPTVVMTILSDLIHDVRHTADSKQIENNWNELKEKIQEIIKSKIIVNLIDFSEEGPSIQRSIFSMLKKNLDWYQLNKYPASEDRDNSFLYRVGTTENTIKLYYEKPNFIPNSRFTIKYTGNEMNTIKIDLSMQDNNYTAQRIIVFCEKLGFKDDPILNKRIISGGSEYKVEIETNEKIMLSYNGSLPSALSLPILRISLCNEGITYLVPIDFIRRLPDCASIIFIILQIILMVGYAFLFYRLTFSPGQKIVTKDQKPDKT